MNESLRLKLLAFDDIESEEVSIPEWGGTPIMIRGLSASQRETWENGTEAARKKGTVRSSLAVLTCFDSEGNRIFTDGDAGVLATKSAGSLTRIYEVAARLSRITKEDTEELEGN